MTGHARTPNCAERLAMKPCMQRVSSILLISLWPRQALGISWCIEIQTHRRSFGCEGALREKQGSAWRGCGSSVDDRHQHASCGRAVWMMRNL
eukprot:689262-Pleurochrysis_carterae.AAC.4